MAHANRIIALWLAVAAALALLSLSSAAIAKKTGSAAPQIGNFYMAPAGQLGPGTELQFTLEGTAKGKATVRIAGGKTIALTELDPGVYEGSYTINNRDRLTANVAARATLTVGGRSATKALGLAPQPAASAPSANPPSGTLAIERFTATPLEKMEPGAELKFALSGTPGAKAVFSIDGVAKDIAMKEGKSGQYEGSYTIRRVDNFPPGVKVVATLEAGGRSVQQQLAQPLVAVAKPPVIKNVAPREGEVVTGRQTVVSGTFDDTGGLGVDLKTVKITVAGNDVTRAAIVTPQFFTYRTDLKPGPYPVEISAKDAVGNPVRYAWTFTVAAEAAPAAAALPLDILSHANNAQVPGGGVEVRGRTAPDARLDVQVQAFAAVAGAFGLSQQIFNQQLRADAAGNFSFAFQSPLPVPGTRYEVVINAAKNDLRKEARLVLFQQK
jgi:hypothetical protein